MLILLGVLPFWNVLRARSGVQAIMRGVNASVVGLLGAALYQPVWTSTVMTPRDFCIALAAFVLLVAWRAPPLLAVLLCALGGVVSALV